VKDTLRLLVAREESRERRLSVLLTWARASPDASRKQNAANRNVRGVLSLPFRALDSLDISRLRSDVSTRLAGGSGTLSSGEERGRITPKGDIKGYLGKCLASRFISMEKPDSLLPKLTARGPEREASFGVVLYPRSWAIEKNVFFRSGGA
jgi:hypothetical protein